MKSILPVILALCAWASPMLAAAQTQSIWRCGADGRSYSATPCAEGRVVASVDARPAEDVKAAHDLAQRENRLAQNLAAQRQQREAVAPGAGLAGIGAAKGVKPAEVSKKGRQKQKHRQHPKASQPEADEIWQATGPASRQKKG